MCQHTARLDRQSLSGVEQPDPGLKIFSLVTTYINHPSSQTTHVQDGLSMSYKQVSQGLILMIFLVFGLIQM